MSAHASAPLPATDTTGRPPPAHYTRLAATGLLLMALAPAVMLAAGTVVGMDIGEEGMFFAILIAVPVLAAALVWRFGTWSKVVGILITLVGAAAMFWLAFGLFYPASFAEFTGGMAWTLGFLSSLGGNIAAIVASRRGNSAPDLAGTERRLVLGGVGAVALAAVVSLSLNLFTGGSVDAADAEAAAATATMQDFAFAEETYTIAAGEDASIVVHNSDAFTHDFTVPDLGVESVTVLPGSEELVTIGAAEPGTYTIYCTLHSDTSAADGGEDGMAATLVVE